MERHSEGSKIGQIIPKLKINTPREKNIKKSPEIQIDKMKFWNSFKNNFIIENGKEFNEFQKGALDNARTIFYYFLKDKKFFKMPNLYKEKNKPDFEKGLLIIGGCGVGKTAIMKTLEACFYISNPHRFKSYNANEIVQLFEKCNSAQDKGDFFDKMNLGKILIDDITTERMASNFGKVNVVKEIIEQRYSKRKLTYATANYDDNFPNDIDAALTNIGAFYGSRVYDRLFEMFNIIIFNGKSIR